MSKFFSRAVRTVCIAGAVTLLAACATMGGTGTPEEMVTKRSQAYWDARIKNDYPTAYSYLNPAYRQMASQEVFKRDNPGTFVEKTEVHAVKCEAEKCTVEMKMKLNAPIPGRKLSNIDMFTAQNWVLEDGQWWLYMKP